MSAPPTIDPSESECMRLRSMAATNDRASSSSFRRLSFSVHEAVLEAECCPPESTYVEYRSIQGEMQVFAMSPRHVVGFYQALTRRWAGGDVGIES